VGSHILDRLCAQEIPTSVLLRPTSDTRFVETHLAGVEIRRGAITDADTLPPALSGVTHVIHCAGCVKARRLEEFYQVNQAGTRNLIEAANRAQAPIERFVHISSLAAFGPAIPADPAKEGQAARPVSVYGKSKWAGELEIRNRCRAPYVIIRPPVVYGPRDYALLPLFRAVRNHIRPLPDRKQELSIIFVEDLADAIMTCLTHYSAAGRTFFAASRDVVTGRQLAAKIASLMGSWTLPLPMPTAALWPVCLAQEVISRITAKASVLSLQ